MKKLLRILWLPAALCLLLSGCAATSSSDTFRNWEEKAQSDMVAADDAWSYTLATEESAVRCSAADGTVLAEGSFELPVMTVFHADGTPYDPITEGNAPAMIAANRFNAFFAAKRDVWQQDYDEVCRLARESYKTDPTLWQSGSYVYEDKVEATFRTNSRMACVTLTINDFTGGQHGTQLRSAYNFDMSTGEEITINDMAKDYLGLRDAVAKEILNRIGGRSYVKYYENLGLFDGYEEIIPEWMSRTIFFGETEMQVVFGVYDIAPYSAGDVVFSISYDLVEPYLNEYGRRMLELN